MNKANNMAAAAVMFSSHGYDSFIQAREDFKMTLEEIEREVQKITSETLGISKNKNNRLN